MIDINELKEQLAAAKSGGVKVDKIYKDNPELASHLFDYNLDFTGFMSDIVDIMEYKPEVKQSNVNILYFTNKCNLNCTYCYEDLPGQPSQILTKEDITNNIDIMLAAEDPNVQTLIVLFGGEPTLEWSNVVFAMDYAYSKKTNIVFNMTTNGIKFLDDLFITEVMSNKHYNDGRLFIDISFDGYGNNERIYHSGKKSKDDMLKVLTNVNKAGMNWRLRYTVNRDNFTIFHEDIKVLMSLFKPDRVITSVANKLFTDDEMLTIKLNEDIIVKYWNDRLFSAPVCYLCCDTCDGCSMTKSNIVGFTKEGISSVKTVDKSHTEFKDFKRND